MQKLLKKYKKVLEVKDHFESSLYYFLKMYSNGCIQWDSIVIKGNTFYWNVDIGYDEVRIVNKSVTLDYFDNPTEYIKRELEVQRIAAKELAEKQKQDEINQELRLFEELKKKYENK